MHATCETTSRTILAVATKSETYSWKRFFSTKKLIVARTHLKKGRVGFGHMIGLHALMSTPTTPAPEATRRRAHPAEGSQPCKEGEGATWE